MSMVTEFNTSKTSPTITRNHLTFQERVALLDEMKKVLQVRADGRCAYMNGWNDERLAKEFMDGKATILNVAHLRKECFGTLIEYSKVRKPTTAVRVSKLELRIERIERELDLMFLRK